MKKQTVILLILACAIPSLLSAQNIKDEFFAQLKTMSSQNKTIESKFIQSKKIKGIKKEVVTKGDYYYDNSGSMAMLYHQSEGDKIIMRDNKFSIISQGRKINVDSSNPMMKQVVNMMKAAMSGSVENFDNGWKVDITQTADEFHVTMIPQASKAKKYIDHMSMTFEKKNMTLEIMGMYDSRGGYTKYEFVEKKINTKIPSSVFEL